MENIKVSNFRKVKGAWDLDLAPITFFTGKNNSGKSSVLKALMVLSDFCNSENHFEISFNGTNKEEHKIKDFSNAINWKNNNKSNLEFDFIREGYNFNIIFKPKVNPYKSKSDEDHFSVGELVSMKIARIHDNALLEIFQNNGECQINIDESYFFQKLNNFDSNNPEKEQLHKALTRINNELQVIEQEIKSKLKKNPNLLNLLGVAAGGSAAAVTTATLTSILAGPLFLAGLGAAGGAKLLSNIKGRELVDLKKNAERLLSKKKDIEKRLTKLNSRNRIRDIETNIFRPKFDLNEIPNSDLKIDKILKTQLLQYLNTNEKELGKSNSREDSTIIESFADNILNSLRYDIFHLSPNRNRQTRLYVNRYGESDINEILEKYSTAPLLEDSDERQFLLKWLSEFEIGTDYKISSISGQANTVEIYEEKRWIDLVDKGFGAGQLFTILLQIVMASASQKNNEAPILLIEEPESNLHPKLQSVLAKLFHEAYLELGVRFIIETHSEYILRKTQVIVNDTPKSNPFAVYYFDSDGPYRLNYKEDGGFDKNFGEGFFDVVDDIALEMFLKNHAE